MSGVFTIPAGTSFVDALAAGLIERFGDPPEALANTLILLPTRRSVRSLRDAFLRQSGGRAMILPVMRPIGDVDEDEMTLALSADFEGEADLPPTIGGLRRQLLLARRIRDDPAYGVTGDEQAAQLAAALASFIDEVDTAEADLGRLETLVDDAGLSEHWQTTLRFLNGVLDAWHQTLAREDRIDPAARRRRLLDNLEQRWRDDPPPGPVIAAGSTGTIPATARLLARVRELPQGMVILPGLDQDLEDDAWESIAPSHPQHALKTLLEHFEIDRAAVQPWPVPGWAHLPVGSPDRHRLFSDVMRPAQATASWSQLDDPPEAALEGLAFTACANPREEAQVAALRMRFELETPERTVALVTRDRDLARRVAADLRRWSIDVDDSAGQVLATTPAGAFFRLVATALGTNWAPVPLLALLKHPFTRLGREAGDVRSLVRRLELLALRGPRPAPGIEGLRHALGSRHIDHELDALLSDLGAATAELDALMRAPKAPLAQLVEHHVQTLENLARTGPDDANPVWENEDGEALHDFVTELIGDAEALGFVETGAYPALLDTLLAGRVVRPRYGSHPRAFIWGPLEARMQHADCVILGGLVEGNWPPEPPSDPWMSRPMRAKFGLATPEQRIGLAAHDFVQAAMARSVLLLYPERAAGAPTVPARWLVRLQAFLDARNLGSQPRIEARRWQHWQSTMDRPSNVEPAVAPGPRPPLDVRPDGLSVTQVEVWQRDPYAIYARRILKLSPLDDLDEDADAANRGSFIHDALERFVVAHPVTLPPDALEQLLAMGRDVLGSMIERPSVATFWWRRFERIAAWFIAEEHKRRKGLSAVHAETTAQLSLPHGPRGSFTLNAKADRLEVDHDGRVAVIDYKTGAVPPGKAVEAGAAPQLPLEAAMVAAGMYPGIPETDVTGLEYWELKGGEPAAAVKRIKADPSEVAQRALEGLGRLVTAFSDEDTPYRDHPGGQPIGRFDAFVDVARTNEWRLGWKTMLDDVAPSDVPNGVTRRIRTQNDKQQAMSNPEQTVWVAASAGTGKTKVLTDRVLRLMLSGSEPSRILCLTFTRAASAEMANRIRQELAGWVSMTNDDLVADLTALQGRAPNADEMVRARQLFAEVLDAPGGLQIATIHSFCQSILGRFPLEAGIAPHFSLIEERGRSELLNEARDRVIGRIAAGRAPELEEPLNRLIILAGESRAGELLDEICAASGRLDLMLERFGTLDLALRELAAGLQLDPDQSPQELVRAACLDHAFDRDGLTRASTCLAEGSKTDTAKAESISRFLAADEASRVALFDAYCSAFLKADKRPGTQAVATKAVREAHPDVLDILNREQARLDALHETLRRHATYQRTHTILTLGNALVQEFRRLKNDRAVLDYDDLIEKTRSLLAMPDIAPWVLFKLDGGLDHVLVDEAQDTNPNQWAVVITLIREFFEGEGARDLHRTVFVVGDEKQSIYSFQGADLEALQQVRSGLEFLVQPTEWYSDSLDLSYRSVPAVLETVDAVFAPQEAAAGVAFGGQRIEHQSFRSEDGGLVELWPLLREEPGEPEDPWTACLSDDQPQDRHNRLAAGIAEKIAVMTGDLGGPGELLESRGNTIRAGDILILVRKRSELVPAIVRELRRVGVAVAGVDRMDLTGEIVVRDLLALGRFCLLPEDDVALASVLKGPLVGFDDETLFDLACNRTANDEGKPVPLWQALRDRQSDHPAFSRAAGWLGELLRRTDYSAPFEFYDQVLTQLGAGATGFTGRKALIHRLGLEAQDPLDEFMNLALAFEADHTPSLQGFVWWIASGTAEVKREAEAAGDAVRIMTVHGAKGLQAPVVFLIDEMGRGPRGSSILWDANLLPLWTASAAERDSWSQALFEQRAKREAEEERRLLYVAMTRASDRLYVCGSAGVSTRVEGTWHDMIEVAMRGLENTETLAFAGDAAWDGEVLRRHSPQSREVASMGQGTDASDAPEGLGDAWMRPLPAERPIDRPISPSQLGGAEAPARSPVQSNNESEALRRGRLVHRLLELLPAIPPGNRKTAATRLLSRTEPGMTSDERDSLANAVIGIIEGPTFAALFGPGSVAEVSVAGALGDTVVAGQIDRLVITQEAVLIVDYKTGRMASANVNETPIAYVRQLAAYRDVLSEIYRDRPISCALLWTDIPYLVEVPQELLDTHSPAMHGNHAA